ncbi:hypothetical protein Dimus_004767 [Dionaea muscipula]
MLQSGQSIDQSPSFNGYSSSARLAQIAATVVEEFKDDGGYDDVLFSTTMEAETQRRQVLGVGREEGKESVPEEVVEPEGKDHEEEEEEGDDDSDFEFAVVTRDDESPISADDIFYNGQIRPIFPLFNTDLIYGSASWMNPADCGGGGEEEGAVEAARVPDPTTAIRIPLKKLLIQEREGAATASCSSSEADELEGVPPGTYCVWTPKNKDQEMILRKKSNSTGSSKRWKFRELLRRSISDGKETFVFLTPRESRMNSTANAKKATATTTVTEGRRSGDGKVGSDKVAKAHYSGSRATRESDPKKSYLPYRQDLIGFFANVNSLGRARRK